MHKMKTIGTSSVIPRADHVTTDTIPPPGCNAERSKLIQLLYTQADCLRMLHNSKGKAGGKLDRGVFCRLSHTVSRLFRMSKLDYEDKERLVSRLFEAADENAQIHQVDSGVHRGSLYINGYFDIKTLQ